jgi:hypothetical protein
MGRRKARRLLAKSLMRARPGCGAESPLCPRPKVAAALDRLAELLRMRTSLVERGKTVRGEDPQRALILTQIDDDRLKVDDAIRQHRSVLARARLTGRLGRT